MRPLRPVLVLLLSLGCACLCRAQGAESPGARDAVHEAIGTLVTLSAGPGLAGAQYRIDGTPVDLVKFDFAIPLGAGWGRPLDATPLPRPPWVVDPDPDGGPRLLEPIVALRFGHLLTEDRLRGPTVLPGGRIEFEALGAGVGLGVRARPWSWLRLEPRVDVVHCRTEALPGGPPFSRAFLRVAADDLVHWRADTISVVGQLGASSRLGLGPLRLTPRATVACVRVDAYSSSSSLQEGGSWSSVASLGLDVDLPLLGLAVSGAPLRLQVGATYTRYDGEAGAAFDHGHLVELPAALYFDLAGRVPYLSRLGVNGEYVRGRHVEGWTVGLDFDF